jgi:O-antigen/teichoic acid export membrane protein
VVVGRIGRWLDGIVPGVARSIGWEAGLALLSFPASILLNRVLGAQQRGVLALALLVPTTTFTLGNCQWDRMARGLITSKQASSREAWRRTLHYCTPLTLTFVPIALLASFGYPGLPDEARPLSALYGLTFPIYFLGGTLQTIFLAAGSLDRQYWARLAMQGSYLMLLFAALAAGRVTVPVVIGIYFCIHVISLAVAMRMRHAALGGPVLDERPPMAPLLRALPPLVAESLAARADIWAFSMFGTVVGVGRYSGLSALLVPVALISNAMGSASVARIDWTDRERVRRYLARATSSLVALFVLASVGGTLVGPFLLSVLLGKTYAGSEWMIPWIAASVVGQSVASQFHTALQLVGSSSTFLAIQSADAAIRVLAMFAGGFFLSERGVLYGLVASCLVKAVWSAAALSHRIGEPRGAA